MNRRRSNRKTLIALAFVPPVMIGMAYAAVPLYDLFCRVTGFAGTPQVAAAAPEQPLGRAIRVRFDASTVGMPWDFKPIQRVVTVRLGQDSLAFYEAHNPTDRRIVGTATYNVTPNAAGAYFAKIDCFCFTEQILEPGQTAQLPVNFFIDPDILNDREARDIPEITLSYTFYETEESRRLAAAN